MIFLTIVNHCEGLINIFYPSLFLLLFIYQCLSKDVFDYGDNIGDIPVCIDILPCVILGVTLT